MPSFLDIFYAEKKDWFRYIFKRLNVSVQGHYHHAPEEAADEVFTNALIILGEKYAKLQDEVIARRTLVTIIRYEVFKFRKKEMDNWWLDHTPQEVQEVNSPPSVRYQREYMRVYRKKHPERGRAACRKYFQAHKTEILQRRKEKRALKKHVKL